MEITKEDAIREYRTCLYDLTQSSKPLINMLTMLAEDSEQHAPFIVEVIEDHIFKCRPEKKLPVLYLIDSIMKNLPQSSYRLLFARNLVPTFLGVFEKVNEEARAAMYKLRQTWVGIVESSRLYKIDMQIRNTMDPAWPVTAPVPEPTKTSTDVNTEPLAKEAIADFPVFGTKVKSCPSSKDCANTMDIVGTAVGHPKGRQGQVTGMPAERHISRKELNQANPLHSQHSAEAAVVDIQSPAKFHEQCDRYTAKTNIAHTLSQAQAQTNTTGIHNAGGKDSPVMVSGHRPMNQVTPNRNNIVSALSTVSKDKVVLQGGGKFEEGEIYMVCSPDGQSQKMVLQNGNLIPKKIFRECENNNLSSISKVTKDKVVLEGDGEFTESEVNMVRSPDGQKSQKILLKNGNLNPQNQYGEYDIKQRDLKNKNNNSSTISTVSKDRVVLEGGGKFEEGKVYMVRSPGGHSQKMVLQNGKFIPQKQYGEYKIKQRDLKKQKNSLSTISTMSNDTVVLEGGGKFEEGEVYMVHSKDGQSQKMVLQNGKLIPYGECERKQRENKDSRHGKPCLAKSNEVKCVKEQQPINTVMDMARNPAVPSSSNTSVRAPIKRKADDAHARQPGGKFVKIKKEGSGHMKVTPSGTVCLTDSDTEMDNSASYIQHSGDNTSIDKPAATLEKIEPMAGTSKTELIACTLTTEPVACSSKTEPIKCTSKAEPMACTSKTEPIAGRSTSKTKLSAISLKSKHSVRTSKTEPIASTSKTNLFESTSEMESIVNTPKMNEKGDASGVCTANKEGTHYSEVDVKEKLDKQIHVLKTALAHKGPQTVPSGDHCELGQSSLMSTSPEDWELTEMPVQELEARELRELQARELRELRELQTRELREQQELGARELRELQAWKLRELKALDQAELTELRELKALDQAELTELRELEALDQAEHEAREQEENTGGLKSLQKNIWQLLKTILPDFDFGNQDNIDKDDICFFRWIIEFYFNEMK